MLHDINKLLQEIDQFHSTVCLTRIDNKENRCLEKILRPLTDCLENYAKQLVEHMDEELEDDLRAAYYNSELYLSSGDSYEMAKNYGWFPRNDDDDWIHILNLKPDDVIYEFHHSPFVDTFVQDEIDRPVTVDSWNQRGDGFIYITEAGSENSWGWDFIVHPETQVRIR